jgi:hypothetical protein
LHPRNSPFDLAIDGVLIVRYMRGTRTVMTIGQIENYLQLLMP